MNTVTPEQRLALAEAGNSPIELADPQTGDAFVLVRAEVYRQLRDRLEESEVRREQIAWSKLARKARDQWAGENPY
jgi:hypothetical protein